MTKIKYNYLILSYINFFQLKNNEYSYSEYCNHLQENTINNEKSYFFYLYDNLAFKTLVDLCCIDMFGKETFEVLLDESIFYYRFFLNYCFLSIKNNTRIIRNSTLSETSEPYTLSLFMQAANWLEREVYDLFGIKFLNHPDLRRILTDYGFVGAPLKKDFPLIGYKEVSYNEQKGSVIYTKISFNQEYRNLDLLSPWNINPNKKNIKIITINNNEKI
jgi:NADH:ubiquinone oxidoreductase subunit C